MIDALLVEEARARTAHAAGRQEGDLGRLRKTSDVVGRSTMCAAEEETTALRTLADALVEGGERRPELHFGAVDPVLSVGLGEFGALGATTKEEDEFFRTLGLLPPPPGTGEGMGGELFEEGLGFGARGNGGMQDEW